MPDPRTGRRSRPERPWRILAALADPGLPLWWPEHFDTDRCPPPLAATCRLCRPASADEPGTRRTRAAMP